MGHLFLIFFALDILATVALAVVLLFLSRYSESSAVERFSFIFMFAGLFLTFWAVSGYLSMNVGGNTFPWIIISQNLGFISVCVAAALWADLLLQRRGATGLVRGLVASAFGIIGGLLTAAKMSAFAKWDSAPFLFYAKWGSGVVIITAVCFFALISIRDRDLIPARVPKGFRITLSAGFLLLTLTGFADLFLFKVRFTPGTVLPRSYPLTAAAYLVFTGTLIIQAVQSIRSCRSFPAGFVSSGAGMLTPREREIASLVLEGKSNKAIADTLCIALPTVKNHLHSIYEKLGLKRRTELMCLFRPPD